MLDMAEQWDSLADQQEHATCAGKATESLKGKPRQPRHDIGWRGPSPLRRLFGGNLGRQKALAALRPKKTPLPTGFPRPRVESP